MFIEVVRKLPGRAQPIACDTAASGRLQGFPSQQSSIRSCQSVGGLITPCTYKGLAPLDSWSDTCSSSSKRTFLPYHICKCRPRDRILCNEEERKQETLTTFVRESYEKRLIYKQRCYNKKIFLDVLGASRLLLQK